MPQQQHEQQHGQAANMADQIAAELSEKTGALPTQPAQAVAEGSAK